MHLILEPLTKCGPISIHDTFDSVSQRFPNHHTFLKTKFSKHVTSSLFDNEMHVYYDAKGKCKGVEIFRPSQLYWKDISVFDLNNEQLSCLLKKENVNFENSDTGINCEALGIFTYSSDYPENPLAGIDSMYIKFGT